MYLTIKAGDKFVSKQQELGNDCWWDGWTMVFYRPDARAVTSKDGIFHDGQWGFANRVSVNSNGEWKVDRRCVRRSGKPRG